jgi:hypothetical protein
MRDPQTADFIIADCGHEVYRSSSRDEESAIFEYYGKTYCSDCFDELIRSMGVFEKADAVYGASYRFPFQRG